MKSLLFILLLYHTFSQCVLHDNSTIFDIEKINSLFEKTTHIRLPLANENVYFHPPCNEYTKEMILYISNVRNLLNLKTNDPKVQSWIEFGKSISKGCDQNEDVTISRLCTLWRFLSPFKEMLVQYLYPNITQTSQQPKPERDPYLDSATFKWFNESAKSNETLSSIFQKLNIFASIPRATKGFQDFRTYIGSSVLSHSYHKWSSFTGSSHLDIFQRIGEIFKHVTSPFFCVHERLTSKESKQAFKTFIRSLDGHFNGVRKNLKDVFNHYGVASQRASYQTPVNSSFHANVGYFVRDFANYPYRRSKRYQAKGRRDWSGWDDPNPNCYIYDPVNCLYPVAAFTVSWLAHLNNEYNTTGCLYKGAPWIPPVTILCRPPVFIGPQSNQIYPDGFDPNNPGCDVFFNPITYIIAIVQIISFWSGLAEFLTIHTGLIPLIGWLVYQPGEPPSLPPYYMPCAIFNPIGQSILIFIAAGIFVGLGLVSLITVNVQKVIFRTVDGDAHSEMPDLSRLVGPPRVIDIGGTLGEAGVQIRNLF